LVSILELNPRAVTKSGSTYGSPTPPPLTETSTLVALNTRWTPSATPAGVSSARFSMRGLVTFLSRSRSLTAFMSHGLPSCVVAKSSSLPSSLGEVKVNVGVSLTTHGVTP
jgi:hypothetical protein